MKRVTYSARCLVHGCGWATTTATTERDTAAVDLQARKHTGEGAFGKKPGPHHPTVQEGVAA